MVQLARAYLVDEVDVAKVLPFMRRRADHLTAAEMRFVLGQTDAPTRTETLLDLLETKPPTVYEALVDAIGESYPHVYLRLIGDDSDDATDSDSDYDGQNALRGTSSSSSITPCGVDVHVTRPRAFAPVISFSLIQIILSSLILSYSAASDPVVAFLIPPPPHFRYTYVLFCSVLFSSLLFSSLLFCSLLFSYVIFCSLLFSSGLFCSLPFSAVLFCSLLLMCYALLFSAPYIIASLIIVLSSVPSSFTFLRLQFLHPDCTLCAISASNSTFPAIVDPSVAHGP